MLTTFLITMSIVALCVAIHYEVLYRLGGFVEALMVSPRQEVVTGVILALAAGGRAQDSKSAGPME